jgi:hypothetical protein
VRDNIESWWAPGNPIGHGNVARNNCVKGGHYDERSDGIAHEWGFRVTDTTRVRPVYVDRAARDFRLADGSACERVMDAAYRDSVPGPDGQSASRASRVKKHRSRPVVFGAARRFVRRGHRLLLVGRISSERLRPDLHVAVFARSRGHRRLLVRVALRKDGAFAVRPHVRVPRRARFVRISAVVRGVGHSRSIRLRVRHP